MHSSLSILFIFATTVAIVACQTEVDFVGTRQTREWTHGATIKAREGEVTVGDKCEFVGNADFYGIGVRIGFYLLWFSGFLDFVFNPTSGIAIGDAQTIFDFANLIAIVVLDRQPSLVDGTTSIKRPVFVPILLLYMFFGGAVVSATTTASFPRDWLDGDKAKKFSTAARQIFVHATFLAMMGYAIYFFVSGYRRFDLKAPCKDVGPRLFPLSDPVDFKDSPIVGLILMPLIIVLYVLILYVAVRRSWTILGSILMLISIVWSITAIEWTIASNNIQGVNNITTTGQLIPFIIGVFSLPTTLWSIYKTHREKAHESDNEKEDSELNTPLKHLTFADAGLESPHGVYMAIQPRPGEHTDYLGSGPSSSELREARTF
ncbi:hypothetical protein EG329_001616 [Mollisiaceae sp. DMI_Dod_QoI]|nr:hypothetical protein EG329_001616 [Helotiales sp. DMI_Dod_QoI]